MRSAQQRHIRRRDHNSPKFVEIKRTSSPITDSHAATLMSTPERTCSEQTHLNKASLMPTRQFREITLRERAADAAIGRRSRCCDGFLVKVGDVRHDAVAGIEVEGDQLRPQQCD
jgi:hypothetical protein